MTLYALDSASAMNATADKKLGYVSHGRYDSGPFAVAAAEIEAATAAGIGIHIFVETSAQRALGGAVAGREDALAAVQHARSRHQPAGSALYFTVDFDPTPAQMPAVLAYLRAARGYSAPYVAGAYGGAAVMKAVASTMRYRCQAAGWSYGEIVPGCNLRQLVTQTMVGGVECDVEVIETPAWGAWNLHGLYPPPPKPVVVRVTRAMILAAQHAFQYAKQRASQAAWAHYEDPDSKTSAALKAARAAMRAALARLRKLEAEAK